CARGYYGNYGFAYW
nr:immunoglobulin heavy chain junction region [Mus musculus]MBK4195239.1 immunoglobulin heavy chain junction region [Mus musculus]